MARKIFDDHVDIDKKLWLKILNNKEITKQNALDILDALFISKNHEERGGKIGEKLEKDFHGLNKIIAAFGENIIKAYPEITCPKHENGKDAPFNISLLGEYKNGFFYWKLRPELVEALKAYKAE